MSKDETHIEIERKFYMDRSNDNKSYGERIVILEAGDCIACGSLCSSGLYCCSSQKPLSSEEVRAINAGQYFVPIIA